MSNKELELKNGDIIQFSSVGYGKTLTCRVVSLDRYNWVTITYPIDFSEAVSGKYRGTKTFHFYSLLSLGLKKLQKIRLK